jgi:hypothetical protein
MIDRHTPKTAIRSALAIAAVLGIQASPAMAAENPFNAAAASDGYTLAAADTPSKCGGGMNPDKRGCKMMQMDSNGDGKVSKDEFMQGHAAKFEKMDSNGDGALDAAEQRAHKGMMRDEMMGKCGQQKGTE